MVGVWWTIRAFIDKEDNPIWWLGLISGVLMIVLAFWTSGQFFLEKAYTLLVFAGIWALMSAVTDFVRAFRLRALRDRRGRAGGRGERTGVRVARVAARDAAPASADRKSTRLNSSHA